MMGDSQLDLTLLDPGDRAITGLVEPDLGSRVLLVLVPRMLSMLKAELSFFSDDMANDYCTSYLYESQN